ncbi:MAG: Hha/YmoA family nucleoid-associated regulatory protein [Arsenophonus sp.]
MPLFQSAADHNLAKLTINRLYCNILAEVWQAVH